MNKMDGVLEFLTPEEIADALRFVEVWEKAGHLGQEEVNEWQRRIVARRAFLSLCGEMRLIQ